MRAHGKVRVGIAALIFALGACGAEIGDSCGTNLDCNPEATGRICDRSLPGGYCTIEGCDEGTCPEDSLCVRFFPVSGLTHTCESDCGPGEEPPCCAPDEVCLSDGLCALRLGERRYCMRACGQDYQCRDDYECRYTGVAGAEAAQAPDDPEAFDPDRVDRFCGPPLVQ